jgi:hypothetical protein
MGMIINLIKEICSPSHLLFQYSDMNAGVSVGINNGLLEGEAAVEVAPEDMGIDLPCEETLRMLGKLLNGLDSMFKILLPSHCPAMFAFENSTEKVGIRRRPVPANNPIKRFTQLIAQPRAGPSHRSS